MPRLALHWCLLFAFASGLAACSSGADVPQASSSVSEALNAPAVPRAFRGEIALRLMRAYKRINAPVGPFSLATLRVADAAAKGGDATHDEAYAIAMALVSSLGERRDALARAMEATIDAAAFRGVAIDAREAEALIARAEKIVVGAELLASGL
jgi:hypothetical protein